jgi:hypothetical protein
LKRKLNEAEAKIFPLRSETEGFMFRLFRFEAKQQITDANQKGNRHNEAKKTKTKQRETKRKRKSKTVTN